MNRRGRPPTNPPRRRPKGDGSIYLYRGRYVGEVTVAGRRRRVSDRTREGAARKLRQLLTAEADTVDARSTVAELAAEWADAYRRTGTRGPTTLSIHLDRVQRHIVDDPLIARIPAGELTAADVERWLHKKIRAGWTDAGGKRRDYARSMINSMRGDLSQILTWAVKRRMIPWNPVAAAEIQAIEPSGPKRTLTADQADRLVGVCLDTPRWGTFALTCLLLGTRPGEAAGLRENRIDWTAGTIRIDTAMKRVNGGQPVALGPVKGGRSRTLEAPPMLLAALRAEHTRNLEHRLLFGASWPAEWDGLIFVLDDGRPPWASTLRKHLRRIATAAEVELDDLTVYELRHSFASLLDERGVPVREITDALGHVDDRMFFRHYRHRPDPVVRTGRAWESAEPAEQQ